MGLSACYPVPCHREGGDIDIYTYLADVDKMSHPEANALADQLMVRQGIEVEMHSLKHSNFTYNGIPNENHNCWMSKAYSESFITYSDKLSKLPEKAYKASAISFITRLQ